MAGDEMQDKTSELIFSQDTFFNIQVFEHLGSGCPKRSAEIKMPLTLVPYSHFYLFIFSIVPFSVQPLMQLILTTGWKGF